MIIASDKYGMIYLKLEGGYGLDTVYELWDTSNGITLYQIDKDDINKEVNLTDLIVGGIKLNKQLINTLKGISFNSITY